MVKKLFDVGVCSQLLLLVAAYTICLFNSVDAEDKQTNETSQKLSPANFFHLGPLTEKQMNSTVTIELNCTSVDTKKNRTAVDSIYMNVHREILARLNRRKSDTTLTPDTSVADTTSTSTTETSTTVTTTERTTTPGDVFPSRRKRRENVVVEYAAGDLRFVEVDPETDGNGILAMSLLLDGKGCDIGDCGFILFEAADQTNKEGTLNRAAGVPVVVIYRGLPSNRMTIMSHNYYKHSYLIWPLVVLLVIILFIIIGGVIYWKKTQTKRLNINQAV